MKRESRCIDREAVSPFREEELQVPDTEYGKVIRPRRDQTWKHKQYSREFVVIEVVSADYVRLRAKDGRGLAMRMHVAQLNEHYEPLD